MFEHLLHTNMRYFCPYLSYTQKYDILVCLHICFLHL